jgi:fimbrial chaperone protein
MRKDDRFAGSGSQLPDPVRFWAARPVAWLLRAAAFIAVACAIALPASAYRVVPLTLELAPSGRNAQASFRIINDGEQAIAIQVSVAKRTIAEDGTDSTASSEDEFVVFPPQMVLRPGQSQAVRVQWKGDPNPAGELPYRIVTEQLPINLQRERTGGAQVALLLRYEGTLYVVPEGAKAAIGVQEARAETGPDGQRRLSVLVANTGNKHAILGNLKVTVQGGGQTVVLEGEQATGMAGANVLAGAKRRFTIPLPATIPVGPVQVGLNFEELL